MKLVNKLLLVSLLSTQSTVSADDIQATVNANDEQVNTTSVKENAGFSIGTIIGGLLAGPPGAILGATGGTWFGNRETEADNIIASLEKELNSKSIELAYQQNELASTKEKYKKEFQQVVHSQEIQSLEKLSQGISYVIYYKTNDAEIRRDVLPKIQNLAELIGCVNKLMFAFIYDQIDKLN
ncbi:MAG: hypothetical protein O7D86_09830 [Proteobacteria bacterium]|nr:hypothetical protein [Pseudomonadota bacterium]